MNHNEDLNEYLSDILRCHGAGAVKQDFKQKLHTLSIDQLKHEESEIDDALNV